ncbi:MAG: hypothetical protein ACOC1V_01710 [Candidatus Saliniplasma sp.]
MDKEKLKDICSKYTGYVLIIGIVIAIIGLVFVSLGSPQTREGEDPIDEEGYTYEVPGPQQDLGMKIIFASAVITFLGRSMGGYFLTNLEKDDEISSNFKWSSYASFLFGIFLAVFGFLWATTIDSQSGPTSGGVPFGFFSFAVKQVLGVNFLISGIVIGISGGYLVGLMLAKKER